MARNFSQTRLDQVTNLMPESNRLRNPYIDFANSQRASNTSLLSRDNRSNESQRSKQSPNSQGKMSASAKLKKKVTFIGGRSSPTKPTRKQASSKSLRREDMDDIPSPAFASRSYGKTSFGTAIFLEPQSQTKRSAIPNVNQQSAQVSGLSKFGQKKIGTQGDINREHDLKRQGSSTTKRSSKDPPSTRNSDNILAQRAQNQPKSAVGGNALFGSGTSRTESDMSLSGTRKKAEIGVSNLGSTTLKPVAEEGRRENQPKNRKSSVFLNIIGGTSPDLERRPSRTIPKEITLEVPKANQEPKTKVKKQFTQLIKLNIKDELQKRENFQNDIYKTQSSINRKQAVQIHDNQSTKPGQEESVNEVAIENSPQEEMKSGVSFAINQFKDLLEKSQLHRELAHHPPSQFSKMMRQWRVLFYFDCLSDFDFSLIPQLQSANQSPTQDAHAPLARSQSNHSSPNLMKQFNKYFKLNYGIGDSNDGSTRQLIVPRKQIARQINSIFLRVKVFQQSFTFELNIESNGKVSVAKSKSSQDSPIKQRKIVFSKSLGSNAGSCDLNALGSDISPRLRSKSGLNDGEDIMSEESGDLGVEVMIDKSSPKKLPARTGKIKVKKAKLFYIFSTEIEIVNKIKNYLKNTTIEISFSTDPQGKETFARGQCQPFLQTNFDQSNPKPSKNFFMPSAIVSQKQLCHLGSMPIFCLPKGCDENQITKNFVLTGRVGLIRDERVLEICPKDKFALLSEGVYVAPSKFVREDYQLNPLPRQFAQYLLTNDLSVMDFGKAEQLQPPSNSKGGSALGNLLSRTLGIENADKALPEEANPFSKLGQVVATKLLEKIQLKKDTQVQEKTKASKRKTMLLVKKTWWHKTQKVNAFDANDVTNDKTAQLSQVRGIRKGVPEIIIRDPLTTPGVTPFGYQLPTKVQRRKSKPPISKNLSTPSLSRMQLKQPVLEDFANVTTLKDFGGYAERQKAVPLTTAKQRNNQRFNFDDLSPYTKQTEKQEPSQIPVTKDLSEFGNALTRMHKNYSEQNLKTAGNDGHDKTFKTAEPKIMNTAALLAREYLAQKAMSIEQTYNFPNKTTKPPIAVSRITPMPMLKKRLSLANDQSMKYNEHIPSMTVSTTPLAHASRNRDLQSRELSLKSPDSDFERQGSVEISFSRPDQKVFDSPFKFPRFAEQQQLSPEDNNLSDVTTPALLNRITQRRKEIAEHQQSVELSNYASIDLLLKRPPLARVGQRAKPKAQRVSQQAWMNFISGYNI